MKDISVIGYKYLDNNDVSVKGVIHVGAHRGEEIDEHLSLGAKKIVWIEANPEVFLELQENISDDDRAEHYFFNNLCSNLDNEAIQFNIIYGPDAGHLVGNKGCSSILSPAGRFESWKRNEIIITSITLDSLLYQNNLNPEDFDMLEVDTQGAELLVLAGAKNVLNAVKYVSLEVTDSNPDYVDSPLTIDIINFMDSVGFDYIETKYLDSNWGDALFIRRV